MLRQVYPAELALTRRPIEKWFENPPFHERRKFKEEDTRGKSAGKREFRAEGWKLIPLPLGFVRPRRCRRIAVVDDSSDRIFLTEYEYGKMDTGEIADRIAKGMRGGIA
jgi:hypothetical protein